MQNDCQRFGTGDLRKGDLGVKADTLRLRRHKKLRETSLHMGVFRRAAKEIDVFAKVTTPSSTLIAHATVTRRINGYTVTGLQKRHTGSAFYNFAGDLVAEDHRLPDLKISHAPFVKVVQIRTADSAGTQADEHFVGTRFRGISVF
jgi:hypothetical protein